MYNLIIILCLFIIFNIFILGLWPLPHIFQTAYEDIQGANVIFALGFLNLGKNNGTFIPGKANEEIAKQLINCIDLIKENNGNKSEAIVLTQKAVSDAINPNALEFKINGCNIYQMHRHDPNIQIRTFSALTCGLQRLDTIPPRIILIAHPRHMARAYIDLKALFGGKIVCFYSRNIVYQDDKWFRPIQWAVKNFTGWVIDYILILSINHKNSSTFINLLKIFDIYNNCPECAKLPKISMQ